MIRKIQNELVKLAHDILHMHEEGNVEELRDRARKVYDSLTLLQFVEQHFGELPSSPGKSEVAEGFTNLAGEVLQGNADVPETNPHYNEQDLMTPVMDTIKDLIEEMPEEENTLEEILQDFIPEPQFVKRDVEIITRELHLKRSESSGGFPKSLNDQLKGKLQIGLNDRIAFIKHLFENNADDYNRVISQINTIENPQKAIEFIEHMVKPDYNHWQGKDIYEKRFMEYVSSRY